MLSDMLISDKAGGRPLLSAAAYKEMCRVSKFPIAYIGNSCLRGLLFLQVCLVAVVRRKLDF